MDIFNAVHHKAIKDTILSSEMGESVELWMEQLWEKGWATLYELTPGKGDHSGFTLALCSPWQQKVTFIYSYFPWLTKLTAN